MLHGRAVELSAVDRLLTGARAGASAALVVRGEVGIGKTALLDHAAASAAATGLRVLRCAGTESEAGLPFAALHLLLRPCLPLIGRLPEPQAAALGAAFGLTAGPAGGPGQGRFLAGMAVLTMLAESARETPLLCVVDDVQWLDGPSADVLLFAARRLGAEGIVLIFASEDDSALDVLPELRLRGLDGAAAAALAESVTGRRPVPSVLDRLLAESGGNPLAFVQLSSALTPDQQDGALTALPLAISGSPEAPGGPAAPPTVSGALEAGPISGSGAMNGGSRAERVFRARIGRLPVPTRALLLVAAADDTGLLRVTLTAAAAAFGSASGDLGPAVEASLVRVSGTSIVFRHPLIRMAAYQRASAADRMAAHRALAGALRGTAHADRRAWHRAAASTGPDEKTARALETTARRAAERRAHATAAAAYERAAELSPACEAASARLAAAARAAFDAGHLTQAARLADRAHHLRPDQPLDSHHSNHEPTPYAPADDIPASPSTTATTIDAIPERLSAAHASLGGGVAGRGRTEGVERDGEAGVTERGAVARLRAAVAFEQGFPGQASRILVAGAARCAPATASLMLAEAVRAAWHAGDTDLAREIARRLDGLSPGTTPLAGAMTALTDLIRGVSVTGMPRITELIDQARRAPLPDDPRALLLASAGLATADHRASYELADALVTACRTTGRIGSLPGALLVRARAQTFLGHHRQAEATAVEALRLAHAGGQRHTAAHLARLLSWLAAVSGGDPGRHGAYADDPAAHDDAVSAAVANWARGLNDLTSGRYASALDRLTGGWSGSSLIAAYLSAPDQVEAAVRCAQPERARATFHRFDAWAAQTGRPTPEALAHRCRALLMPPGSPDDDRQACFEAALRAHHRDPQPYEQARTELVYGQWLRRTRRKRAARELLEASRERFDQLGARPWARRAAAELRATGDPRHARAAGHVPRNLLTAQERQIARLASRGVRNRDIAAQLFLSPRTVGNHLYNVFRKLGITSRRDLGTALGLDTP